MSTMLEDASLLDRCYLSRSITPGMDLRLFIAERQIVCFVDD